ncbi:MAG: hypothetical protein ACK5ML_03375 [Lachnospiraceae bacterium]
MKKWLLLRAQKKNNKGSSLVLVVAAMSLIGILVSVMLSMTLINYRMKHSNLASANNFYSAESALDEIKTGLSIEVGNAASSSYVKTMTVFNSIRKEDRTPYFQTNFAADLRGILCEGEPDSSTYSLAYLDSLLVETATGAVISSPGGNAVNITAQGVVLKNVCITYTDSKQYETQIQTDIILNFPGIDFSQQTDMPDLLNYSIVANDSFLASGVIADTVKGNVYLGKNGVVIDNASSVLFTKSDDTSDMGLVITNQIFQVSNGSQVKMDQTETWAKSILVDSSKFQANGSTYLSNDVIADNTLWNSDSMSKPEVVVSFTGDLIAYGNLESASDADSLSDTISQINSDPAAYSSSIIVNGINTTIDLAQLTKMIISGNSYIATSDVTIDEETATASNSDVAMGESISMKADQRAYLVPTECIAPENEFGGANPMTRDQYANLIQHLGTEPLVDYYTKVPEYGQSLKDLGVSSYQTEYYPVAKIGSMVYLFMIFDSETDANAFFNKYYTRERNQLQENLDLYTNAILLPSDLIAGSSGSDEELNFYYNGNILINQSSEKGFLLPSEVSGITTAQDKEILLQNESAYQNKFAALQKKLVTKFHQLTPAEKSNDVYDNLVYPMISANADLNIPEGSAKEFASPGDAADALSAIVVNGDYTIDTMTAPQVCVVIAEGNITVKRDFSGLILAKGTVTLSRSNLTISPNAKNVSVALKIKNDDDIAAADYLLDGGSYLVGGMTEADGVGSSFDYLDLITYKNWYKQ